MVKDGWYLTHTPAEIITQVATTTLAVISTYNPQELIRIGWLVKDNNGAYVPNPIIGILYSMTSAGAWIARTDTSGLVREANSSLIKFNAGYTDFGVRNLPANARLIELGEVPYATSYPLKVLFIQQTLGAGGTLAATQLLAAQAGVQYYIERVTMYLDPATANLAAAGGNAAIVTLQDDAGTPVVVGKGVLTNVAHNCKGEMLGITTANQDLDIVVDAGTAGNVGAATIYGCIHYREIS